MNGEKTIPVREAWEDLHEHGCGMCGAVLTTQPADGKSVWNCVSCGRRFLDSTTE